MTNAPESGFGTYVLVEDAAKRGSLLARRPDSETLFKIERLTLSSDERAAYELDQLLRVSAVRHKNLVGVVEVGTNSAGPFVVTDYVEGASLATLHDRDPDLRPRVLLLVAIDTLYGLHAAHAVGVVHGNVCPDNILVGSDGISRIQGFHRACDSGALYLAPEQLSAGVIDPRCDVFAMGVVLWNMLTNSELYRREQGSSLTAVYRRTVPRPSAIASQSPAIFDSVVLKALERDPAKRFATCEELAHALRDVAHKTACLATPADVSAWVTSLCSSELAARTATVSKHRREPIARPAAPEPLPPAPRRRRSAIALTSAGVIGILVVAWIAWRSPPRAVAQPSPALEIAVVDVRAVIPDPPPTPRSPQPARPLDTNEERATSPKASHTSPPQRPRHPPPHPAIVPTAKPKVATPEEPQAPTPPAPKVPTPPLETNPYVYK
jgi:serine/threonine protein kinase